MDDLFDRYEAGLTTARQAFFTRLAPFFAEKDPRVMAMFLIQFCSQGVGMTEPVPDWIRRAGEGTKKMGFEELGTALVHHAAHEADHHEMFIADTKALVAWWNDFHQPKLSPDKFLHAPYQPGVLRYRRMHEDYIAGPTPYCQIAIEYEIEKISVDAGPKLFGFLGQGLGPDIMKCLSFITEHVAIDVGHTQYNQRAMKRFLVKAPEAAQPLIEAGRLALDCYADYVDGCLKAAKEFVREGV